jgi:hypothetical protein
MSDTKRGIHQQLLCLVLVEALAVASVAALGSAMVAPQAALVAALVVAQAHRPSLAHSH